MKVNTGLAAGSVVDDAWIFVVNTGDKVVGFVKEAENQATGLTNAVVDSADSIWQGFVGLFR